MKSVSAASLPPAYLSLAAQAAAVREYAYAPYSCFPVGCALLASSGRIYTGVNCENASFGGALCAERAALSAAVTAGERRFTAVAICAAGGAAPCGICRQLLCEFGDMDVMVADADGDTLQTARLSELLPHAFSLKGPVDG